MDSDSPKRTGRDARPYRMRPRYVVLESDWGLYLSGKVLAPDEFMLAALDRDGVKYRAATVREIELAAL